MQTVHQSGSTQNQRQHSEPEAWCILPSSECEWADHGDKGQKSHDKNLVRNLPSSAQNNEVFALSGYELACWLCVIG